MRTTPPKRIHLIAQALALAAVSACHSGAAPSDHVSAPDASATAAPDAAVAPSNTIGITDTGSFPPAYTETQCESIVSSFPGWDKVAPVPMTDAQGRPTFWYAIIPVTAASQIDDLTALDIYVEEDPLFISDATLANQVGQSGVVTQSGCYGAQFVWGIVPGVIFNSIIQTTAKDHQDFNPIILQPVPMGFDDATITYESLHPFSDDVLVQAGLLNPAALSGGGADAGMAPVSRLDIGGFVSDVWSGAKKLVSGATNSVVDVWNTAVDLWNGAEEVGSWIDRQIKGSINLTLHLDVRNTDLSFGGPIGPVAGDPRTDTSTPMVRTWGSHAGSPIQLGGVTVVAKQSLAKFLGVTLFSGRSQGTTDANSNVSISVAKSTTTGLCIDLENAAGSVNQIIRHYEVCSFEAGETTADGKPTSARSYDADTTLHVELQNKYVNVLAQLSDGQAYLHDVAQYSAHKATALVGDVTAPISKLNGGRAVTPCLGLPNQALDLVNLGLDKLANLAPWPLNLVTDAITGITEKTYEVDMWLPDVAENLTSRSIVSHEYGHFAMCSMLYDEDKQKSAKIPSLIVQRIVEGTYMNVGDETTRIMEGWADYFAGQTAGGYGYFDLQNGQSDAQGGMKYCEGTSDARAGGACWDWNYVEDTTAVKDPANVTEDVGTPLQMRRFATTLFDAFDGHARGGDDPGAGDFWHYDAASARFVPATNHRGDATDETVALPGSAMRAMIHDWAGGASLLDWRVDEAQVLGALNQTIRATAKPGTPGACYSWCDACQMFAQHDGRTCAMAFDTEASGECMSSELDPTQPGALAWPQLVAICARDPVRGFVGMAPNATDPTSACTFTGCGARSILVGTPGDAAASCLPCGQHQISVGATSCATCATPSVGGVACMECPDAQIVGGAGGNTCVSCPPFQIPDATRTSCVSCGYRQVVTGASCQTCPTNQIAAPSGACTSCPAGQLVYGNECIPQEECTCTATFCRMRSATTPGVCVDTIG
ncbi:MAG TPA: hypothetical protein VH560_18680 [Polyangia bacterium]|nr:hypothetical protein [Polyangia bacterium]